MKDLFGNEITPVYTRPNGKKGKTNQGAIEAHKKLVSFYGETKEEQCKSCTFLMKREFGKVYYKCTKYKTGASQNSDWRVSWIACGLFQKDTD